MTRRINKVNEVITTLAAGEQGLGISLAYIHAAIRRYADRGPIERGELPLVPPATPVSAIPVIPDLLMKRGRVWSSPATEEDRS
jgi:hypothetical protein